MSARPLWDRGLGSGIALAGNDVEDDIGRVKALRFLWIVERYFCELGLADARPRIRIELKLGDGARRHVGNLA